MGFERWHPSEHVINEHAQVVDVHCQVVALKEQALLAQKEQLGSTGGPKEIRYQIRYISQTLRVRHIDLHWSGPWVQCIFMYIPKKKEYGVSGYIDRK